MCCLECCVSRCSNIYAFLSQGESSQSHRLPWTETQHQTGASLTASSSASWYAYQQKQHHLTRKNKTGHQTNFTLTS